MIRVRSLTTSNAIRSLPGNDALLRSHVCALADSAQPVLLLHRAKLIAVTAATCGPDQSVIVTAWDRRCVPTSPVATTTNDHDGSSQARSALETMGKLVLADLIRRWPTNACPPYVGVVTDGTGVAFSTDHPSPLTPDWLSLHQARLCPTVTLAPFAPYSFWTLLTAPGGATRIH